jgi:ABC-2 type transport system ATP-binding protein
LEEGSLSPVPPTLNLPGLTVKRQEIPGKEPPWHDAGLTGMLVGLMRRMQMIMSASGVVKDYRYFEKSAGIGASIKDLFARKYLYKRAVDHVSFQVEKNEIIGLVGPNGAGKTTILKMLSGIIAPSEGTLEVLGFNPCARKREFKKQIGFIMGNKTQAFWDLPATETFMANKIMYDVDTKVYRERIEYLGALLRIKDKFNIPVRNLSFGERMKVEFVSALVHAPRLVFLDEPTIGLDFESQKNLREYIRGYFGAGEGVTFIITSHNMQDIETLCGRIMIIKDGKLIYDGKKKDMGSLNKKITVELEKEINPAGREELLRRGYRETGPLFYEKDTDLRGFQEDYAFFSGLPLKDISFKEENFEKVVSWYLGGEGRRG